MPSGRNPTSVSALRRWLLLVSVPNVLLVVRARIIVPNLPPGAMVKEGDINIGHLTKINSKNRDAYGGLCGEYEDLIYVQRAEAARFVVDHINARQDLLPNLTMGYVVVDDCGLDMATLGRALYFIPNPPDPREEEEEVACPTRQRRANLTEPESELGRHYDVVGIVGPSTSRQSVMVASLMSLFHIPVLSTTSTSDELSDKSRYEYFMRLVPPDRFQVQAMLDVLVYFNWTYVSFLYTEGSYGEYAAKELESGSRKKDICIAFSQKLSSQATDEDYERAVAQLLKHRNARVVVSFMEGSNLRRFFEIYEREGLVGEFVWLGSDYFDTYGRGTHGAIATTFHFNAPKGFPDYIRTMTVDSRPDNPWVKDHLEFYFECQWNVSYGNDSCHRYRDATTPDMDVTTVSGKIYDAYYTYAYALHALITDKCPLAFQDKSHLKGCIKGSDLLQYMKNTTFMGVSGRIKFDELGDMQGEVLFEQIAYKANAKGEDDSDFIYIGVWNKDKGSLYLNESAINWTAFANWTLPRDLGREEKQEEGVEKTVGALDSGLGLVPESLCSKPCPVAHYRSPRELPCCWDCRRCRENEHLVENQTSCAACPVLYWPDKEALNCLRIEPDYLQWSSPLAITLIICAALGFVFCVALSAFYAVKGQERLIKASSRELSAIILAGCALAYFTVLAFLARPAAGPCYITRLGFSVSVALIYAPLLVKTSRIYRIFSAGKRGVKRPRYISSFSQLIGTFVLVTTQVVISVVTALLVPPSAVSHMLVPTEKYVELSCSLPLRALLAPLSFNLALVLLCALCAFLTRTLPENFNESWYIFVSVSTTSFLWLVFLPTYFTTFYAVYQVTLLAFCLVINASITLLCLYVPKVYAVLFVDETRIQFGTMTVTAAGDGVGGVGTVSSTLTAVRGSKVAPASSSGIEEQNSDC